MQCEKCFVPFVISVHVFPISVSGKSCHEFCGDKFSEHSHYTLFRSEMQEGEIFNFGQYSAIDEELR